MTEAFLCAGVRTPVGRYGGWGAARPPRQGHDLSQCARAAVAAHALAGESWASKNATAGMLASELANLIPAGLDTLRC